MRYRWLLVWMLLVLPATALAQTAPQLHWQQYDNIVEIQQDGNVQIREQQVLVVDRGPARGMNRTFETGNFGRVTNIRVSEDGQLYQRRDGRDPGTYSGSDDGSQANIRVNFRDPDAQRHTITIQYTISRSLVADNNQAVFDWNFFWSGSSAPEIRNGSVVLRFPGTVGANQLKVDTSGVPVRQTSTSDSVRWELTQPIQGQQLGVQAAFPRALLTSSAQFRSAESPRQPPASVPSNGVPSNGVPAPGVTTGLGIGGAVFCLFMLLFLFIAFSIIRASVRSRRVHGYPTTQPTYDQDPFGTPYTRRGWRRGRRYGGWGGGFGVPPIIIMPPSQPHDHHSPSPFDNTPFDSGSGGGGSSWGDSSGGGSSWGDSSGGGSSWGSSSGGGSSWGDMGGGGSSWGGGGDSGGGGGGDSSGGSGGGSFD
ncbi:MAG TPA: DUF2207 domain-containing protein [Herpetosiphonaceae bacterium]